MMKYAIEINQSNLTDNKGVHTIRLANSQITEELAITIAALISRSNGLDFLEFANIYLSSSSLLIIFQALSKVNILRCLILNSINIDTKICADSVISIIENDTNLEHLEISRCSLIMSEIANVIGSFNSLKYLSLSKSIISNAAARKLRSSLKALNTLKQLDLSSTTLQNSAFIDVMQGLSNTSLEYLSLNNCNISSVVATKISSCVIINSSSLQHLELCNCKMEEESLICIIKALANITSLRNLNLYLNTITEAAAIYLSKVLQKNQSITSLNLTMLGTSIVNVASSCKALSSLKCINLNFPSVNTEFSYFAKFCLEDIIFTIEIDNESDPYASIDKDIKNITYCYYKL